VSQSTRARSGRGRDANNRSWVKLRESGIRGCVQSGPQRRLVKRKADKSGAKTYPMCTLTFDAGFLHYSYGELAGSYSSSCSRGFYDGAEKTALAVGLFFHWLVKTGEGQSASLLKKQYAALPAAIQSKAEEITAHEYFKE
jgi:hypothetical protein